VLKLAWPLLIAQITQTAMGVSDTIMAGRYSALDMAAVAVGFSITIPVLFFFQGLALALPPIVSRLNGAKQFASIPNMTQQTFWVILPLAIVFTILSQFAEPLLAPVPMGSPLKQITAEYISYVGLSFPLFALYQVLRHFCEGLSITKPTMLIMLTGLLVNIPANYILIYGKWGVPAMGGAGCGLATALVICMMCLASLLYVAKVKKLNQFALFAKYYPPNNQDMATVLKLGLPIAFTVMFETTLFSVIALLLAPLGANTVASHQVALNFSALIFMIPLALGMATCIRVSFLLGENQAQQAKQTVKLAMLFGMLITAVTATFTIVARTAIGEVYTNDLQVIRMAANLMFLAALFQFSDAVQVVAANALRGYKDTTVTFIITFIAYWIIGLPLGCVLALTDWIVPAMAAAGFWIGIIFGLTAAAIMLGLRLRYIQANYKSEVVFD
jgi:MATE family multidrug resistance protein